MSYLNQNYGARSSSEQEQEQGQTYGFKDYGGDTGTDIDDVQQRGFQPRMQQQEDTFLFKPSDLPGVPKVEKIRKLVVSQQTKVMVTETNRLYRWRVRMDSEFKPYQLPQTSKQNFLGLLTSKQRAANIRNIYVDPKGHHCIIVCQGGQNYYLNFVDSKPKLLKQIKGVNIRAIAFHGGSSNEQRSGDILISIDGGVVLLYRLERDGSGQVRQQIALQYQLYLSNQVTNLDILRLTQSNNKNYVIVVLSTNSSIVCLTGLDDLQNLLTVYKNQTEKIREVPMPRSYQSMSQVCYSKIMRRPTCIIWANNNALIRIRIPQAHQPLNDAFLSKSEALRFAKRQDLPENKAYQVQQAPLNIGVTDFHYYLLFQDSITIMSSITQKIVMHQQFKGTLVSDMAFQRGMATFWIFSNKGVIKLDTKHEGDQAWKLLLEEKKYKQAYTVCKAKNQNVSYVAGIYADHLFQNKDYSKAALYFSQTSRSFEQIFLKFLQADSDNARDGLQLYLQTWLKKIEPAEKSQRCLLVSWLVELMVYRLNRLEREGSRDKLKEKQRELEDLLAANIGYINEEIIYLIMQSHGRIQNLINFADKKNNFEMIVMHYLSEQAYEKALEYLKNVKDPKVVDVVYKYAHIFFRYQPQKTVSLLVKSVRDFKPIKLMPGLMNIPDNKRIHGIELLRYCIEELRSRQKSLHNILIFFYATSPKEKGPQLIQLMQKGRLDFDLDFGLRLFKTHKMVQAQIIVYGKMYLYGQAVAFALENNKQQMAKKYADKPEYQDQRKKLWIQIAKHYLLKKGRVSDVIQLTKQSKIVKIEDLLPFFTQNIKIQNFKDEICQSLKSYSAEIGRLKSLMDSYSTNAQQLKNQLRMVKNRCIQVDSSHKCQQCFKPLFGQQFYIFPCMHGFHRRCLISTISSHPSSNATKLRQVQILAQQIKTLQQRIARKRQQARPVKQKEGGFSLMNALNIWSGKREQEGGVISVQRQETELKAKKAEIDSLLAAECPYCGPSVVETITMPFDNQNLRSSWKI